MERNQNENEALEHAQDMLQLFTEKLIRKRGKFFLQNKPKKPKTQLHEDFSKQIQDLFKNASAPNLLSQANNMSFPSPKLEIQKLQKLQSFVLPDLKRKKWGNKRAQQDKWQQDAVEDVPVFTVFEDFRLVDMVIGAEQNRLAVGELFSRIGECDQKIGDVGIKLEELARKILEFRTDICLVLEKMNELKKKVETGGGDD